MKNKRLTIQPYYDANMKYFGLPHAVYGALAIVCLLIFVLAPITVTLYHSSSV